MTVITVKYFGRLTDITGLSEENITVGEQSIIESIETQIIEKYTDLKNEIYVLFLNRNKVQDKTTRLKQADELCLMPPFSGG